MYYVGFSHKGRPSERYDNYSSAIDRARELESDNPDKIVQVSDEAGNLVYESIKVEDEDNCPRCGSPLKDKWSGVKCTSCSYAFCY